MTLRKLLALETVRVARGRTDGPGGPLRATDRLADVRLGDVWIHESRGSRVIRVEVARPGMGDGRRCQPRVHGGCSLVSGLGAERGPRQSEEGEYKGPSKQE